MVQGEGLEKPAALQGKHSGENAASVWAPEKRLELIQLLLQAQGTARTPQRWDRRAPEARLQGPRV